MSRVLSTAVLAGAIVSSILAVALVLVADVVSGVTAQNEGGNVLAVQRGSIGWQDGIRAGQQVIDLRAADEPGGWRIATEVDGRVVESTISRHVEKLRAAWPLAAGTLAAAAMATLWHTRRRKDAQIAASTAIVMAAVPSAVVANQGTSIAILSAALIVPGIWVAQWTEWPRAIRWGLVVVATVVAGGWVAAGAGHWSVYPALDEARFAATVAVAGLMMATALFGARVAAGGWLGTAQTSTAISLGLLVGLVLVLYAIVRVPVAAVIGVALIAAIVFPRVRRTVSTTTDRLLFADRRARLIADATEAERARLAREIHDVPLQELSGVIRQLDLAPALEEQTDALRGVAEQLRHLATGLRPPALDDLGLAAALRFVADHAGADGRGIRVVAQIAEQGGDERPPPDVELAVLRIVQEALANAVRHSSATEIRLSGAVRPDQITIEVHDDGRGIAPDAVRAARQRGSMGLSSMEHRAEAIGASLALQRGQPHGTRITLQWLA